MPVGSMSALQVGAWVAYPCWAGPSKLIFTFWKVGLASSPEEILGRRFTMGVYQ